MASHLLWFKLSHGRVWHVACSGASVALCGQSILKGERQPKRPPFGARPCPDCDLVAKESQVALAAAAVNFKGLLPAGTAFDPSAAFHFTGATITSGSLHFDEGQEFRRDELRGLIQVERHVAAVTPIPVDGGVA